MKFHHLSDDAELVTVEQYTMTGKVSCMVFLDDDEYYIVVGREDGHMDCFQIDEWLAENSSSEWDREAEEFK